ncbi:MAG: prepilin-type N-terminal cleavage/methylation domain-containing protein [Candidatus Eisenbacteria bacterium]|uniref:Prepilin-type N-terminal cleavage/methylation domain-containing protein n=1 Tax=Eiseniibacteriota bacterium TaxID=2212470 RepID=A0A948RZ50_UNCEI|nr:prepilin-type N-terminal cleavage/methylation domain-containing protein [Candidatus Eisenbacteria bacterium]MBU1950622.1 prepilin-type N-terminal cleavage/methylation domain-containing protein [Candidatus Eisenbacteria bacterium]MBU2692641.1 prepilin-type N-terminal cleavage/methylation domain-containing protein [Candidatus Eisenbacteria bacterium]
MSFFHKRLNQKGFTMIELMVVVVVVAILAAIAVPLYGKYIRNARLTEATGRIGEIITASKAYAQEHQDVAGNPTWPPAVGGGIVDLSATELFTYTITAGGGANASANPLTIRATGTVGLKMAGVLVDVTVPNINSNGSPPIITNL